MSARPASGRRKLLGMLGTAGATILAAGRLRATSAPDRELIALCARFDRLEGRILAMGRRGPLWIADDDQRELAAAPLKEQQRALLHRICALRAATLPGLQARAATLSLWLGELIGESASGYWNERMLAALLRDMAGAV